MYSERQNEIIRILSEVQFARIEQLAKMLFVSGETVRRDLIDLERDGVIKRTRGGAAINTLRAHEADFSQKMENFQIEKLAIAREAMSGIQDNDAVAINNGTTNIALSRLLAKERKNLTIITNSFNVARNANENPTHNVIVTGGHMRKHNGSLVGDACMEALARYRVDKVFANIDGLSLEDGVMERNAEEAAVIRRMLSIGRQKIILAEARKFHVTAMCVVCPAEQIDLIVTDWSIMAKEAKSWCERGVRIAVAQKA